MGDTSTDACTGTVRMLGGPFFETLATMFCLEAMNAYVRKLCYAESIALLHALLFVSPFFLMRTTASLVSTRYAPFCSSQSVEWFQKAVARIPDLAL